MSEGGRHVARREDDKCAAYGSLFIGQSSGTQVETEGKHDGFELGTSNAREICFGAKACDEVCHERGPSAKWGYGVEKESSRDYLCFRKRSRGPPLRRTSATG